MKDLVKLLIMSVVFLAGNAYAETGVSRSIFTTAIENKEPVSELKSIENDIARVYLFTELNGLNGHTIVHRWEYNSNTMAEVSFVISADRWRTWSSKSILPEWTGTWTVSVLDEGGNIIDQNSFEYVQAEEKPMPVDEPPVEQNIEEVSEKNDE